MEARQAYLFRHRQTDYECVNPDCYLAGVYMGVEEVALKNVWDSALGTLTLVPYCLDCNCEVLFWHVDDDIITRTAVGE